MGGGVPVDIAAAGLCLLLSGLLLRAASSQNDWRAPSGAGGGDDPVPVPASALRCYRVAVPAKGLSVARDSVAAALPVGGLPPELGALLSGGRRAASGLFLGAWTTLRAACGGGLRLTTTEGEYHADSWGDALKAAAEGGLGVELAVVARGPYGSA